MGQANLIQKRKYRPIQEEFLSLFFRKVLRCFKVRKKSFFQASGAKTFRTRRRQYDFVFFAVRDIPLRFISSHLSFVVPTGQIDSIFVYTLRRVHDLSCSIFLVSYRDKNVNFRIFRGRGLYFQSCLNNELGSSNLFKLIDGTQFSRAACCDIFREIFFSLSFCQKSRIFWIFSKQIWPSPLPTAFLNFGAHFLRTHL